MSAGPAPWERNVKWAAGQKRKQCAGLPNRELEACTGSHQPETGHAGKGARWRGRLRAHPKLQAGFPSLWPPPDPRAPF